MNKTMRKVVAFAATAAMAISLIPSAFASTKTSALILIDDVKINKTDSELLVRSHWASEGEYNEMAGALAGMEGKYNDTTNTFTVTKRPGSIPYIRPYNFCDQIKAVDSLNYAPYIPLTVNLGFFDKDKGSYVGFSEMDEIYVDDVEYKIPSSVVSMKYTEADLFWMFFGGDNADANVPLDNSWYKYFANQVAGVTGGDAFMSWGKKTTTSVNDGWIANIAPNDEGTNGPNYQFALKFLTGQLNLDPKYSPEVMADMLKAVMSADSRILSMRMALGKEYDSLIDQMIKNFTDTVRRGSTSVGGVVGTVNAISKYVDKMCWAANRSSTTGNVDWTVMLSAAPVNDKTLYWGAHVFHNARATSGNTTHTVKVVYKGKEYTRTFTVAENLVSPYYLQQAKRIAGINYENMLAEAVGGNLQIRFSMKDLRMSDTWGTASTIYKLWDASIRDLSGAWIGFNSSVKQGDTAFFNTNVTPINGKGEKLPAGTKLTLTFNNKVSQNNPATSYSLSDYTYQYSNKTPVVIKDDNSFDFELALNRSDMEWLYNGHWQNYVRVDMTHADGTYEGTFYVTFSSTDRVTTSVSFAEGARISLKVGETKAINAVLTNAMSTKIDTFTSSHPAFATVTKTGDLTANVTGVALGTTVVTAKTANGESAQIVVDVVADEPVITAKTYKVVTTSSALNVRSGAGTSYGIIGKLSKGSTFQGELNAAGDWVKLNYNGQTGYVSAKYVIAQ